jgi:glycosyltransferase involved in cell wall biosynthesis
VKKFFFGLVGIFSILFLINIIWLLVWSGFLLVDGIQTILQGKNLLVNISESAYLKWILMADLFWIMGFFIYISSHKGFKTKLENHYLQYYPINNPKICMVIPAYNEELSIEKVVKDFLNQQFIHTVIVVDNHSSDKTAELAEKSGAKVIRKPKNRGLGHSFAIGLIEGLKTDANIIATTESDGTYNAYDVEKFLPYLNNSDMVIGSRRLQILTQRGNQNKIMYVWGNYILAKLIQLKFFSAHHLGIANLSDVGCVYRFTRREALEKIADKLLDPKTGDANGGVAFALYLTMLSIENDLRFIEIPVTYKKRVGESKMMTQKTSVAIKVGLKFLWLILAH